jgi:hypothetical protein
MNTGQGSEELEPPVKVAEKNLSCYFCGGLIRKGNAYLRKDFVKTHYQRCPAGELALPE